VSSEVPKWAVSGKQKPYRRNFQAQAIAEKSINGTSIFIMLDYLKDEEGITWRI
jgi:hypothetical protein